MTLLLSLLRPRPGGNCRSLGRSISRLPLPPSIPPSALRPLVAFAPSVPLPAARLVLPAGVRSIPLSTGQTARYVQEGGPLEAGGRECWILDGGTVVGWNIASDDLKAWAARLHKQPALVAGQADRHPSPLLPPGETEQLDFLVDRSSQAPRLEGDIVILPSTPSPSAPNVDPTSTPVPSSSPPEPELTQLLIRYAISEALSHSPTLSIVEARLDALVQKDAGVPSYLAKHGHGPYSRKEVIQRLGELLEVRQKVSRSLGDVPDLYWEEPLLEKYFKGTWKILEIEKRVRALHERIAHAQDVHGILRDLLTEKSTHSMETVIIILIAVEVVLAFWTHWEELRAAVGLPSAVSALPAAASKPAERQPAV